MIALILSTLLGAHDIEVSSPEGRHAFHFEQRGNRLLYSVTFDGKTVIEESELGVDIDNRLFESALGIPNDTLSDWGDNLELYDVRTSEKDTVWTPVYGERATVKDRYNSMRLCFRKSDGRIEQKTDGYDRKRYYFMDIVIRAYDEGIAFRYEFPEAANGLFLHIVSEKTSFRIPEGAVAFYERWAQGPYERRRLDCWDDECERPLTIILPDGTHLSLAEAAMTDYSRGKFRLSAPGTLQIGMYSSADIITPYSTPWRVVMAGERATDLINHNDIILNLNKPCAIEDVSWIRPGKAFRCDLTQEAALAGVDFAEKMGLDYIHLDAGWYGKEMMYSSDATQVIEGKDLDIPAICSYAASKGIGVFLYVNQRALYRQFDEILPLYRKWGVAGIKFGFVQIGNQMWTTWLHDAVRKCAEYGLLVDIHDEYRPTGYSRTYPNLLTQEGIRGNEEMPDATHNVTLPFTRFIAGAADYTLCYFNGRVKTTKAHQLAMAAVYYSPLQFMFWYDKPSHYHGEKELEFWKAIPSVWDDSKALDGAIGEFIVQARRSGTDWFVGAMTNVSARTVEVDTADFLEKGRKYKVTVYEDDPGLGTRTNVRMTVRTIRGGDTIRLALLPSGGAALHFTKTR